MPINWIVPTADALDSGNILTTNDYTNLDDGITNGLVTDSDDTSGATTGTDDQTGNTAIWIAVSGLASDISSVNSATFRVRARITGWSDDTTDYRLRCIVGGTNYDIHLTTDGSTNNYSAYSNLTTAVGTSFTRAQYEAAQFSVIMQTYGKSMSGDGVYLEIDAIELEVDYIVQLGNVASYETVALTNVASVNGIALSNVASINTVTS